MANGDLIKLGTLYLNDTKQLNPTNPVREGNIPKYASGNIEIKDTEATDTYKINWIETTIDGKKLLIADRNILVNASWDTLNAQGLITGKDITIDGQKYRLRILTGGNFEGDKDNNEWDKVFDVNSDNLKWHWQNCFSWVQNAHNGDNEVKITRGSNTASFFGWNNKQIVGIHMGWRPVLENQQKYLIQQNNQIYTIKAEFHQNLGQPKDDSELMSWFEKYGADDLTALTTVQNRNTQIGSDKGVLGSGKCFEVSMPSYFKSVTNINTI